MKSTLIQCVALRAAAAATAPLLYAPIDRTVCVPTVTDDGAGPSFCVDFVREDLFAAAERFCDHTNVCSGHEAGALLPRLADHFDGGGGPVMVGGGGDPLGPGAPARANLTCPCGFAGVARRRAVVWRKL